ncbi:hypothetical protein CASFOL_013937 [Castilleja foliolosa]|uniref:Cyclin-B3-1 n=1 Tax=Castilleja foliolosa TaxID=1961234 RepID=A0ABD3DM34_9LAMI
MVAVKERLNSLKDRVAQDQKMSNSGPVKNFKIYVEADRVKNRDSLNNGTKEKSIPHNSSRYLFNANDSKNIVKNLEKSKNKPDKYGRKVLADIGNVRRNLSKNEEQNIHRPGKGKTDTMLYPKRKGKSEIMLVRGGHRDAADLSNVEASSLDKHPRRNQSLRLSMKQDSMSLDQIQATDDSQTSKKHWVAALNKSIKSKSDELRTKFEGRSSAAATGRKSARIPLHLTRKSLPVLKQVSRVETIGSGTSKDNSEKSDSFRGKAGFPVKPSVRRKSIIPKPTTLSSRPHGNRVSDGFIVTESRAQTKVDAGVLSRISVKPTVKTTVTSLNTRKNSKPSHVFTTKKSSSKPVDLSKRKQASENIPCLEEPAVEEDISGGTVTKKKSNRRNSFTCSLVSRSKERSEVTCQETLPSIDDDRNHLEVCEYVDDIYQYYWVMEGQNPLLKNYMGKQREISPQMRCILINWLVEVHQKFDLMEETLFLTVTIIDRYLSLESIKKNEMQLVGLTALLLASKYEDFWHPRVKDLISISAESYNRDQMLKMEKTILKKLKFRLNEPTSYVFMIRFLKAAQSDDTKVFEHLAFYLIELCLVEYEALNYKPSMLCASAIYLARCTMRMTLPWTPLLAKHARYEESQIRGCANMILKFHKAAKTSLLKVSYEKYSKVDYSRVATIKPLDRLPA